MFKCSLGDAGAKFELQDKKVIIKSDIKMKFCRVIKQ